jgi:hypothetical protein
MIMVRIENLGYEYVDLAGNFPLDGIPVIVREGINCALCVPCATSLVLGIQISTTVLVNTSNRDVLVAHIYFYVTLDRTPCWPIF